MKPGGRLNGNGGNDWRGGDPSLKLVDVNPSGCQGGCGNQDALDEQAGKEISYCPASPLPFP
jgi:hypothetical protein